MLIWFFLKKPTVVRTQTKLIHKEAVQGMLPCILVLSIVHALSGLYCILLLILIGSQAVMLSIKPFLTCFQPPKIILFD